MREITPIPFPLGKARATRGPFAYLEYPFYIQQCPPRGIFLLTGLIITLIMIITEGGMVEMFLRNVPNDLHRRFKLICVEQGISMNKQIIELIRKHVERQEKKAKK